MTLEILSYENSIGARKPFIINAKVLKKRITQLKAQKKAHTFDMSQEITEGSLEMRSKEKTLFFTFFARRASPGIQRKKLLNVATK